MSSEITPLLGDLGRSLTPPALRTRVHFLDNLRATLTVLFIFHRSVLEWAGADVGQAPAPKAQLLPLSLFTATNNSALWVSFFFVSGYATTLSLTTKAGWYHLALRILKIGVPALIYFLYAWIILALLALRDHWFSQSKALDAPWWWSDAVSWEWPVAYVALLILLDTIYVFSRWFRRRTSTRTALRLPSILRRNTKPHLSNLLLISIFVHILFTFIVCLIYHSLPYYSSYYLTIMGYEIPTPDAPVSYIIAYIGGINFPSIKKHLLPKSSLLSWAALLLVTTTAYSSLGLAQHLSPAIWEFIRIRDHFEWHQVFYGGGFNGHTIFFVIWNTFVSFTIPLFLVAVFANTPWTKKEWSPCARRTYSQIYTSILPIMLLPKSLSLVQNQQNVVVKSVLVGYFAVICSGVLAIPSVTIGLIVFFLACFMF